MDTDIWTKVAFASACVVIPIAWGWLVNALFVMLDRRRNRPPHDPNDDYQI